jgi:predicted transposase/invertase (TIGR01784 family)
MVELPKFTPTSITEKKMAVLWLRFLKEIRENEYIEPAPELMENDYIRKAIELCEEGAFNEAEIRAYERYWDSIRKEKAALADSRAEGKTEGKAEGKAEGIEIGRTEGIEIGEKRGKAKTVVNSFKNNLSIEIISSITQLSNDEVVSILKKYELM